MRLREEGIEKWKWISKSDMPTVVKNNLFRKVVDRRSYEIIIRLSEPVH